MFCPLTTTSMLQCCHGFSSMDTSNVFAPILSNRFCFNVAMDFHPWIQERKIPRRNNTLELQCCHGFSSMDTSDEIDNIIKSIQLQCCHGFSSMDTSHPDSKHLEHIRSFNVAMDFHPWIQLRDAYMQYLLDMLQCCHGFSSMDTKRCYALLPCLAYASMLPWIFIHGYIGFPVTLCFPSDLLQCCHGFSSMDTRKNKSGRLRLFMLQCCHGFSSMDTGLNNGIITQVEYFMLIRDLLIVNSFF